MHILLFCPINTNKKHSYDICAFSYFFLCNILSSCVFWPEHLQVYMNPCILWLIDFILVHRLCDAIEIVYKLFEDQQSKGRETTQHQHCHAMRKCSHCSQCRLTKTLMSMTSPILDVVGRSSSTMKNSSSCLGFRAALAQLGILTHWRKFSRNLGLTWSVTTTSRLMVSNRILKEVIYVVDWCALLLAVC